MVLLAGAGKILGYLLGVDSPILGIWIATGLIWFVRYVEL
eukprot:SAG31_NODE_2586_length_5430_cov_2.815044_5_plen_40_part_00